MIKQLLLLVLAFCFVHIKAQFPDSNEDGKYYSVNRAKIWTVSHGNGDPLFIIPGGPGGAHVGMRAFDSLADVSKLVYFDAFGRGKSDTANVLSEYSLPRDIDDLEKLRIAMGFEKINILGHSYGSLVAQGYSIKYPKNVSHLILVAPFHSNDMWQANDDNCNHEIKNQYPEIWDSLMLIRDQGYVSSDPVHYNLYDQVPYSLYYVYSPHNYANFTRIEYPNKFNNKLYYQMVGADGDFVVDSDIGSFDYRPELKGLEMPVLIAAGRFDRVATPRMMMQYKEYCPQAEFVMFEKSGHNPFIEEPVGFFTLLKEFIKK